MFMEKNILLFAYQAEKEAAELYYKMSQIVKEPFVQIVFRDLAQEEEKHQALILKMHQEGKGVFPSVPDLRISEAIIKPTLRDNMTCAEIIAYVIKMEEEAMTLYTTLANATQDPKDRATYLELTKMESTHKYRFERVLQDINQWQKK